MKFRSLRIYGFGMLSDTGVEEVQDGLVLLEGSNGAGKSTLLEFLTSALFGYERGASGKYAETSGVLRGGVLTMETADGQRLRWERGSPPPAAGSLSVQCEGVDVDAAGWLGSANRDLYGSVFALGIDQLREKEFEADRQSAIEAAITGMGVKGLPAALSQTDKEVKRLAGVLRDVQGSLDASTKELDQAKAGTREYDVALDALAGAKIAAADLSARHGAIRLESSHLGKMSAAWGAWCDYEQARVRLAELPTSTSFESGSLEKLRGLRGKESGLNSSISGVQRDLDLARAVLCGIEINEGLISATAEIESLAASAYAVREVELGLEDRERQVRDASRSLDLNLLQLGADWGEDRLKQIDTSLITLTEGGKLARSISDGRQEILRLRDLLQSRRREWTEASDLHKGRAARARAAADEPGVQETDRRLDVLEEIRSLLSSVSAKEAELSGAERWRQVPAPPPDGVRWMLAGTIAVLSLVGGLASGRYYLIALGLLLAGGLLLVLRLVKPRPRSAPELDALRQEIEALRVKQSRLAEAEGWTIASAGDIQAVLRDLRSLRDQAASREVESKGLADSQANVERLLKLKTESEAEADRAEEQRCDLELSWRRWCAEKGYPEDLDADSLGVFEGRVSAARMAAEGLASAVGNRDQFSNRIRKSTDQLVALKLRLAEPSPTGSVADAVADLDRRLKATQEAERLARLTRTRITDLEQALESSSRELESVLADIGQLLAGASVASDTEFEVAFAASLEASKVKVEFEKAKALIVQISGPGEPNEHLRRELATIEDGQELLRTAAETQLALDELAAQLRLAENELIRLEQVLKSLESGADLGAALARRAEFQAEFDATRRLWLEAALTKLLLAEATDKFQSQVQDAVFERASHYMSLFTDGVSERVRKEGETYYVLDRDGTRRSVSQLNRSHAERLLLSVRLGYIDHYCDRREPLPIVLDDVLVNFDPRYQTLAVRAIADLAKRHQVIYLTCHPSTRDLFQSHAERFQHIRLTKWRFESKPTTPP